ncbi:3-hydroxyacyl-ACP dehydratase FabZ family protein [Amycolatopsis samaneae]|uniref:3-hydroxyacyl-ACP dehydratase FabZ family protein n=1 Tax=Amycolatopsis samaneae TaxID=664691 RepID=A0ABW5GPC3_9PSEU
MTGTVVVTGVGADTAIGTVTIGADEAVFTGHYPGFPVLPGVCLIEVVRSVLLTWLGEVGPLAGLDRSRFHRPVRPDEEITAAVSLVRGDNGLACTATVAVAGEKAADLRLRFRSGGAA